MQFQAKRQQSEEVLSPKAPSLLLSACHDGGVCLPSSSTPAHLPHTMCNAVMLFMVVLVGRDPEEMPPQAPCHACQQRKRSVGRGNEMDGGGGREKGKVGVRS